MFGMLVWKKIRASFGEMYFWFIWVCARPLAYVLIFSLFKRWADARTGVEVPYAVYTYSGLILWYYFVETAIEVSSNVRANAGLIGKIYIPRLLTPAVPVVANLVDLAVAAVPLVLMMLYFGVAPGWGIAMLVPTLLVTMLMALGIGFIVATITLHVRDFQKVFEFSMYIGMFISPVIFSPAMIPESVRHIYDVNPMVGVLQGWRASLIDVPFPWEHWLYALAVALALFIAGLHVYRKYEHKMIEAI